MAFSRILFVFRILRIRTRYTDRKYRFDNNVHAHVPEKIGWENCGTRIFARGNIGYVVSRYLQDYQMSRKLTINLRFFILNVFHHFDTNRPPPPTPC
jgi:hypothetical protein